VHRTQAASLAMGSLSLTQADTITPVFVLTNSRMLKLISRPFEFNDIGLVEMHLAIICHFLSICMAIFHTTKKTDTQTEKKTT
jgi:hypothetical protein